MMDFEDAFWTTERKSDLVQLVKFGADIVNKSIVLLVVSLYRVSSGRHLELGRRRFQVLIDRGELGHHFVIVGRCRREHRWL